MKKQNDSKLNHSNSSRFTRSTAVWALLIAVGAIGFIYLVLEGVEHLWRTDKDLESLCHQIRGVCISVTIGFLFCWYILRTMPSIFPSSTVDESEMEPKERVIHLNWWFIRMRWAACTVSAALIIVTVKVLGYLEDELFLPLITTVAFLVASNIAYIMILNRQWLIWQLREIQIAFDLVILTIMLHYSGGIENPLLLIYIFHVIIGGILLSRRKCYAIVIIASLLFCTLAFFEMTDILKHYTLHVFPHLEQHEEISHAAHNIVFVMSIVVVQLIVMSLTAFFTTSIIGRLRSEERHVQDIRQRLERIVEASGAGYTILDAKLQPVWLNNQIKKWLNLSAESIEQSTGIIAEWIGGANGVAAETLKDRKVRTVERQHTDSAGNKRFFQVTVAPLTDDGDKVHQVVEFTQDITNRKMVEAEMMHSSKMAALGTMAAGIAHEIGNPLASITMRLRLLKEQHDEGFWQSSLDLLEKQIARISRTVHGIRQLARPMKTEGDWTACKINSIVEETVDMLKLHHSGKRCQVQVELVEDLPPAMVIKDQLIQVFLNLGLNALEAMPNGGNLTIRTFNGRGEISVSFEDTGEGMGEEIRSKIFTPFFTTKKSGMGLGLWIVHNIISAHGGRIEVKSKLGAGSVSTVVLPVRRMKKPPKIT